MGKGKSMQVIVKKTYPQIEQIFKIGDEVTLQTITYDKDTVLYPGGYTLLGKDDRVYYINPFKFEEYSEGEKSRWKLIVPPLIAPKGSCKEVHIVTADGNAYSNLHNFIGFQNSSFSNLFTKKLEDIL